MTVCLPVQLPLRDRAALRRPDPDGQGLPDPANPQRAVQRRQQA
jgi:hypothetical protein